MSTGRGRRAPLVRVLVSVAALAAVVPLARRWLDVVEVRGRSMEPTLRPGDRLLVERVTFRVRRPRSGDLVLAPDPRQPTRELIKRVAAASRSGVSLRGDNPVASTDARTIGLVPRSAVRWRALARYWPLERAGPLGRASMDPGSGRNRSDGRMPVQLDLDRQ